MNMCYNCLDRHVIAGRGDRTAMIFDSPVTDTIKHITYQDILGDVQQFAGQSIVDLMKMLKFTYFVYCKKGCWWIKV